MKTTIKKRKIITDVGIDGPMMTGRGMTKAEEAKILQWVNEQKAIIKAKQVKSLSK